MNTQHIQPKNIALSIVFSLITCGIYQIYWFITCTNDMNDVSENPYDTSGGMAFLLTVVTCNIYGLFWAYKLGQKVDAVRQNPYGNTGILYLLLELFGFQIIVLALAQDTLNTSLTM